MLASAGVQKRSSAHPFSVATRSWKKKVEDPAAPPRPASLPQWSWCHPPIIVLSQAGAQKLWSAQVCTELNANTVRSPRAWSVSTTGLRATWRDSWSRRMTLRATAPGWTRASATPLCPSPELWAPSTARTHSSRTPWTACTKWSRSDPCQRRRRRRHRTPTKAWRRSGEAAVHWSKVRTSRHLNLWLSVPSL